MTLTLGDTVRYAGREWIVLAILRAERRLWIRPVEGGHTEWVDMEDVT